MQRKSSKAVQAVAPKARRPVNSSEEFAALLLKWYDANRRILPFREDPTAYHIWVSEVMLQQTQVKTMLPYYRRFIQQLPDVAALAACDEQKLHKLWEGLGYYSRVRNLQKAAQIVVQQYDGQLPGTYDELRALPGIGGYTAGAIASIAYGLPCVAVDGNVLRVFARLLNNDGDITKPAVKHVFSQQVAALQSKVRPGDYNQALMELGALVCLSTAPGCENCPVRGLCAGCAAGRAAQLPVKAPPKPKVELPVCGLVVHSGERVLLHRRGKHGLLAGLWEPLVFEGEHLTRAEAQSRLEALLPDAVLGEALPGTKHIFTHRVWNLYGWHCIAPRDTAAPDGYVFANAEVLAKCALPGAFSAWRAIMAQGLA